MMLTNACSSAEDSGCVLPENSWIKTVIAKLIHSPSLRIFLQDAVSVTVIAVQRYLADWSSKPTESIGSSPPCYYYDVTFTDGHCKEKWHLAPELNLLVQKNILRCGTEVKITKCAYIYNEKKLSCGVVCIEEIECGKECSDPSIISYIQSENTQSPDIPLMGGRKHYLPLWNNCDPCGDIWMQNLLEEQLNIDASKVSSVLHLEMLLGAVKTFPPLLVKILHKSRLRYFGKPDKKHDVPYQAYFEVADHSGMISMVLWNALCPEWFKRLKVGTVLFLQQYTIKQSYPYRTQPTPGNSEMKRLTGIEICLNPREPLANIHIIPEKLVKQDWKLPEVKYHFITRTELNNLPHNHTCDIIGLVTFVGRSERNQIKDASEDFWLYRWVHIIDGTSEEPFILELFATSQPDIFEHIHPMTYLVCTQMRVVRDSNEKSSRTVYLTTSNESEMFITGCHRGQPYTTDVKVKQFIQWIRTQSEVELIKRTVIGGYYPFPPSPPTFLQYCKDSKVESVLITTCELKKEIENLHYREHKRVALQGIIAAVRYVCCSNATEGEVSGSEPVQEGNRSCLASNAEASVGHSATLPKHRHMQEKKCRLSQDKENGHIYGSQQSCLEIRQQNIVDTPVKRKTRKHRLRAKQKDCPALNMPLPRYLTRSARQKLSQFPTSEEDISMQKEKICEPKPSSSQTVGEEFEQSEASVEKRILDASNHSWESELWSEVKDNLIEHLQYSHIFPESMPRKFDYVHKEILMQQYNLYPGKYSPKVYSSNKEMHEFQAATSLGHYKLTILGINHKVAIHAAFLPVFCSEDAQIFGTKCIHNESLLSSSLTCRLNKNSHRGLSYEFPLWAETVKAASDLDKLHVICILDICHLGGDKVEVFLNRIYKPTKPP
uniref:RPA-related protein RADX n=1 Tax=Geotrypetes seraphini TaxID=260995 RepID=A0A6P8QVT1_GEOSA|nr:RPA-related protein RADX [Geotrypetes seraphini]XP_033801484.1 RPA-related protein RADX [Geotrypetes seraphini]XP_033801485.1 RPA-related protein RADX [Geotrypetes seraphini]XP_033801486.1 RPA-related protein RADX [Geotrypetes seraphini]XP_033801487.1 RPA-related protein RADX [Geotrypetes seraphini]XP_033801488.1 RPA-related protein RADX [Geotrypetes seraphini]